MTTTVRPTVPLEPPVETVRLELDTALIIGNRQVLKQRVLDLIDEGKRAFVIDFARCGYVDNSGLGVLVSCSKKIHDAGGSLVLVNMSDDLYTLFELTRLDTIFIIRRG